ncbi:hypothetical protein LSCM4_02898 [Leishmania orientalis]|uniref:Uncharacterized protein n=1 Tax=Leishmania orientalis TaxID=2249476 RepID=A0A836GBC4_9TRYP|nr:hypothetical protein LSCM4_02898 [Leishmania orientalis]
MKVNIRAISDALDGILAAEASAASQITHSAIIKRHSPLVLQSNTNSSQSKCLKSVASRTVEAPADAGSVIEPSPGLEKSRTPKNSTPHLQSSFSDGSEKKLLNRRTKKKGLSPEITRKPDRGSSPPLSNAVKNSNSTVADFLARLGSIELVAFKVVEATGVGLDAVLLTPRNVGRWISRCQLPSNSWVTSVSLSREACVLLELENQEGMRRRKESLSHTHSSGGDKVAGSSTETFMVQDFIAMLVVEDGIERRSLHANSLAFSKEERYLFNVVVETSSSARGSFLTLASTSATPGSVTTLKIPGTLLKAFVRIAVCPTESEPRTKLIKVRAVCFFHSDTWTAAQLTPLQKHSATLEEEEGEATLRESMMAVRPKAQSTDEGMPERVAGETEITETSLLSLAKQGQDRKGEGVAHPALSVHDPGARIANFVKAVALARLRQDSAVPKRSCLHGVGDVEYDWFLDTLVDVSTAKVTQDRASSKASTPGADSEAPELEYIRALQAWSSAPALSVEAALTYCLSETTSFSASTLLGSVFFGHEAQEHLSQPFKLHVLVISFSEGIDRGRTQAYSSGVSLPPVHIMSAIASEVASLGYTTELLFTCPVNNGFGCAIRPYSCSSGHQGAHYKLIFVVPAQSSSKGEEGSAAGTMELLLRTALSIFLNSSDMRGSRLSPGSAFSSHSTPENRNPCGALRLLIDGMRCFDYLMPVLAEWAEAAGSLRYYGSAAQRTLQLLFFPSCFISNGDDGRPGDLSELRHDAQWSGLSLRLSGIWRKNTDEADSVADDIVALEAECHCPATYVWQSGRGALRLVLTDAHFMEYFTFVDGVVAPSPLVSLATNHYRTELDSAAHTLPLTTFSEAPWMTLLQAAERLHKRSVESPAAFSKDAAADFFALRHRITISFAFHILSTAFKRGWARVSASIPLCDGNIRAATIELQEVRLPPVAGMVSGENGACNALRLLDEDAFMDTLLQWQYPFPNVVVLHCTDILCAGPKPSPASTTAPRASSSRAREGVLSLFSEELLHTFVAVSKPDEALS